MGKLSFEPNIQELIRLAASAASEGKYVICVHNLNDAYNLAKDGEERSAIYRCYADMFIGMGNYTMARNALFRSCKEMDKGGYYSVSYDKFIPENGIAIEENEFPVPDSDTVLGYNDVYNFFLTGQYEKGLDILCELPPDLRCLDEVISVLYDCIENGESIDLTPYAYKMLILTGIYAPKSGEYVRLMLQGGSSTRKMMIDASEFFASESTDINVLKSIAEAYADEEEYESALVCFDRVLEECEVDELALFYESAIRYKLGDTKKADKYFAEYKLVYGKFGAPINLFAKMFMRGIVPIYGSIPATFVKEDADAILHSLSDIELEEQGLTNCFCYASESVLLKILSHIDFEGELVKHACAKCLLSPFVSDVRKRRLLAEILRKDVEDRIAVAFENKGVIFSTVKFTVRTNKRIWHTVYERISLAIIGTKEFLTYRPSFLSAEIKRMAKACAEQKIAVGEEDIEFLCAIMASHYADVAKKGAKINSRIDIIPTLSPEELKRGLNKFPPEGFVF